MLFVVKEELFVPTGIPFLLQEKTGLMPAFVAAAEKLMGLPAHMVDALAVKITEGGTSGLTRIIR